MHRLLIVFVVLASLSASISALCPAWGQPANPRAAVQDDIRALAKRHVDGGASMQTSLAIELFKDNQAGLTTREIVDAYEQSYLERKRRSENFGGLDKFFTPAAILGGILVFVAGVVFSGVRQKLLELSNRLWDKVYVRFAGTRLFRRTALKRYRAALKDASATFTYLFDLADRWRWRISMFP